MRQEIRRWRLHRRSDLALEDIVHWVAPILRGWVRYYGLYHPSKLREDLRTIDMYVVRWAYRKYKRFGGHTLATWDWLRRVKRHQPTMFAHWSPNPKAG
jgi:RNA-directed DNA polymerase